MGDIILWTSVIGLKNLINDRNFYAYSEKTRINNLQVSLPVTAICLYEDSTDPLEGVQFYFHRKSIW